MRISVGVGGTHKTAHSNYVGVGGAWKRITGGWIGVSGAWKRWYAAVSTPNVSSTKGTFTPTHATASLRWDNDGTIVKTGAVNGVAGTWLAGGDASDFEVYLTQTSGDAVSGSLNSWLSLGTDRTLTLTTDTVESLSASGTYTIRTAVGGTELGTGTWSLTAIEDF